MPYVVVKLYAGQSQHEKACIAEAVAKAVTACARCAEASVSVSVEDVDTLYVKPGYDPR